MPLFVILVDIVEDDSSEVNSEEEREEEVEELEMEEVSERVWPLLSLPT